MRKRFVYIVLIPTLLVSIVVALFVDSWVEAGLEYAGERVVKAKVEIDGLSVSLFPVGMAWDRLQVTDPSDTWKNMFESGPVRFSMDAGQLLRAKFIVETISVEGFVLGTKRTTDGKIDRPSAGIEGVGSEASGDQAGGVFGSGGGAAPIFDLDRIRRQLNLDSLTNPANLETYRLIDSLSRQLTAAQQEWDATLAEVQSTRDRISAIEAQVRSIDVGAIKSIESAQKAFNDANTAYQSTQNVLSGLDQRKAGITENINGFSSSLRSIDGAASRDFERVISAAKLPDVSMKGLAGLVLGGEIVGMAHEYLGYVDLASKTIPKYTPKPDPNQPRRSEGVVVHFPDETSYPKYWIKEIVLSGGTDSSRDPGYFYATGSIRNISNDQRLTKEPITAELDARKHGGARAVVQASFDRRNDVPLDTYRIDVSDIAVGDMALGSASFLPSKITDAVARASIAVDVPGAGLESSAKVSFGSLRVAFDRDPSSAVERLVRDVLAGVRSFFVNLRLWKNDAGAIDVSFETDLDDQLSSRARSVIGAEVARIRSEIKQRVDAQIARKRQEIESAYARKRAEIQSKLSALEQEVRTKVAFVESKKKELEDRVEQEKKKAEDELKKKAGDALKGILRRNG